MSNQQGLTIRVVSPQGLFFGQAVDIKAKHEQLSAGFERRGMSTAAEIRFAGIDQFPPGPYKLTITPTDEEWEPQSQFVILPPPSGSATLTFTMVRKKSKHGGQGPAPQPEPKPEPEPEGETFVVRGRVRRTNGTPVAGVGVEIFDKDLRHQQCLGKCVTDADGNYTFTYTSRQFRRSDKGSADLIIHAVTANAEPLATSPVLFQAKPVEEYTLTIGGDFHGPSEFDLLLSDIAPVLDGAELHELSTDDCNFLAGETGHDLERILLLAAAAKLARESGAEIDLIYGLLRQELPSEIDAFLAVSPDRMRTALTTSSSENIIAARLQAEIGQAVERIDQLRIEHALRPPVADRPASGGILAGIALSSRPQQAAVISLLASHTGSREAFWETLSSHPEFSNAETVATLRFTFDTADLTANHLPAIQRLKEWRTELASVRALRDLARLEQQEILALFRSPTGQTMESPAGTPGDTPEARLSNYVSGMMTQLDNAFPTQAIERQIKTADLAGKSDLLQFFTNAPEFEFGTVPVSTYLEQNPSALADIAEPRELEDNLAGMDRLFRIAPEFQTIQTLVSSGISSAQQVAAMGRDNFIAGFAPQIGTDRAAAAFDAAEYAVATTVTIWGNYSSAGTPTPAVVPQPQDANARPEWRTFFGSIDFCECRHCRSVLSPAAYLVDLLQFTGKPGRHPGNLTTLLTRRPDIAEIQLSCKNTNTAVPYIDLANELMADAVVPVPAQQASTEWQTKLTADEAAAAPEHLNSAAYQELCERCVCV